VDLTRTVAAVVQRSGVAKGVCGLRP